MMSYAPRQCCVEALRIDQREMIGVEGGEGGVGEGR